MELNDYKKAGFLPFCIQEISLAYKNGVDSKLIEKYMNNREFDNMQLMQIRYGLESGIDVSAYASSSMPSEEMERIRMILQRKLKEKNLEEEKEERFKKQKLLGDIRKNRLNNTISVLRIVIFIGILCVMALFFYFGKKVYDVLNEDLFIKFKTDEVSLEYLEPFVPEDYVEEYTKGNNIMIIFPSFIANELGEYAVTYQLSNGLKTIRENLKIKVIDTEAPYIKLKEEFIELRNKDDFDPNYYIEEIHDNCDKEPKIEIDEFDLELKNQEIHYKVSDFSGNTSEATLTVSIEDKQEESQVHSVQNHNYNQISTQSNNDEYNHSTPPPVTDTNQPVVESQTAASVQCHNSTVALGTDPGEAAYSTYDGISGNITISIQYPELNTSSPGVYPVYYINTETGETVEVAYVTVVE